MVFDDSPLSDRRSIPPVSRSYDNADGRSGWTPILIATGLAAVAFGATHLHRTSAKPGSLSPGFDKPRPVLVTEAARRPAPEAALGHRKIPLSGSVVPRSAVVNVHGAPIVFVSDTDYHFVVTPVVLGEAAYDGQRILSGVSVGQVVVTDGAEALKERLTL